MQVNASIDEADIGQIATGQPVAFRVDAYPTRRFSGTVSQVRLHPVVAQNVVSYVTVIDVPNKQMKLKPGMTANVTDRDRARRRRAARAECGAAIPADVRRTAGGRDAARRGQRHAAGRHREPSVRAGVGAERRSTAAGAGPGPGISDGTTTAITGGELTRGRAGRDRRRRREPRGAAQPSTRHRCCRSAAATRRRRGTHRRAGGRTANRSRAMTALTSGAG